MTKLLLIDDDEELADILMPALKTQNYIVDHATTADLGRAFLDSYQYEIIILDWELPGGAGVDICRQFRAKGGQTPVLMLTGRKSVDNKTLGLESGSDDYMTKPYEFDELIARIRALLRRPATIISQSSSSNFGDLVLRAESRQIEAKNKLLMVSPIEFELLAFLIKNPETPFSFEALRVRVWQGSEISKNAISAVITRLRKKLAESASGVNITTVDREFYKLEIGKSA